jgi:hypothetical protein
MLIDESFVTDARRRALREAELAALDWIAENKASDHWHPEACQAAYMIADGRMTGLDEVVREIERLREVEQALLVHAEAQEYELRRLVDQARHWRNRHYSLGQALMLAVLCGLLGWVLAIVQSARLWGWIW